MTSVFPIAVGTQSYDWGKVGLDSKAARYALNSIPDFKIDELKPYAEVRSLHTPRLRGQSTDTNDLSPSYGWEHT